MTDKVEELRWLIADKADEIWSEGIKTDPLLRFDRVKVALENMIEENYMVPNMWEPEFVRGVDIRNVKWLLDSVDATEMLYELNGGSHGVQI